MGFKRLEDEDLVISTDSVANPVWSGNNPTLTEFYTSSVQEVSSTGEFYYSIYQNDPSSNNNSEVQFNIAYCDSEGSGSNFYNALVTGSSPTKSNYNQYRNLILGDGSDEFIFGGHTGSYFYAINVNRARYKQHLLPGTMTLELSTPSGDLSLTDDSKIKTTETFTDAGRVYNLVSGSSGTVFQGVNNDGFSTIGSGSYGLFLPDVGMMLLNGAALDGDISLDTTRSFDDRADNPKHLFEALNSGSNFTLNSEESLSSDFLFIRARNSEFNYSENPSFISGSTGEVLYDEFIDSPQPYITTVGMYNDNNELLSVAKLSRPLQKDFTKELLIRVKLDF
jgi:hypothetical protein